MPSSSIRRSYKGHLGRLTPEQEQAFATFKVNLEKAGLYNPATETSDASHDDATVLRFLRARRFDPAKAQKQFADRIAWEKKHDVHNLFANFPTEEFESSRRYYPRWTGRRDKDGLPLYVYKLSALSSGIQEEIGAVPPRRRYERIVALYEVMTRFVAPLCTYLPHEIEPTPISAVTTIIDLAGVSAKQMWSLRSHLQEASELANANYPETLGTVVVVNAPSFFSTVWGWVKVWFDENTRDKIHILGNLSSPESTSRKELASIISPSNIPKTYGGEMDWDFFDEPSLDEDARKIIGEVPKGPWIFKDGKVLRPKEYKGDEHEFVPASKPSAITQNGVTVSDLKPITNGTLSTEDAGSAQTGQNGSAF